MRRVCSVRIKTRHLGSVRPGAALCPCLLHVYFPAFLPGTEKAADPAVQGQVGRAKPGSMPYVLGLLVPFFLLLAPSPPSSAPSQPTVTPVFPGDTSLRPCPPKTLASIWSLTPNRTPVRETESQVGTCLPVPLIAPLLERSCLSERMNAAVARQAGDGGGQCQAGGEAPREGWLSLRGQPWVGRNRRQGSGVGWGEEP